jgi:PBSX family phage terminase large subunit
MSEVISRRIQLRGAALDATRRRDPELLLCGPAGTGKSYAALWKVHLMCMANPGMRALVVRKTHKSLTSTGLVTFKDHVAADAIATGICRWYGGSGEKPAQYIYSNGSVIVVGGLDQPAKIMSSEYDVIFVQEATDCTKDDWEKLTSRLRNGAVSFQQLIADCNPQHPSHWLKKRCDDGATAMLYSRHEDNPRVFEADGTLTEYGRTYIARLDALTGVRKERLRHGRWVAAEGIIYEGWRPEVHLTDRKVLPREWTRLWAVDFGFTNPFVWQMWAVDPDGRLWLEKEIYRTQRLVEDHAKDILAVVTQKDGVTWKYPKPRAVICDHDAEDRATLERHVGMGTVAAWKSVSDGIEAMQARLKVQGDGKPRLFVCRDSLVSRDEALVEAGKPIGFAQEIEGYVRMPTPEGKGTEKEEPLKENDHSMDAGRYVVAYQDLAPAPRVRWL